MWFLWARWRYTRRRKKEVDIAFQNGRVNSPLKIIVVSENEEVPETIRNIAVTLILFSKKGEALKQEGNIKEIAITRKDMKWFKPLRGSVADKLSRVQGDVLVVGCRKITPEVLNLIMNFSDLLVVSCAGTQWIKWSDWLIKTEKDSERFWNAIEKIFFNTYNLAEK